MSDMRIVVTRNRHNGQEFVDECDEFGVKLQWDADADELADALAGLMVLIGFLPGSIGESFGRVGKLYGAE